MAAADEVDTDQPDDLAYDAWVLLANGGYWDPTDRPRSHEWNDARDRWRDRWHATLPLSTPDEVDEAQA